MAGFAAGGAATYLWLTRRTESALPGARREVGASSPPVHPALKHGVPKTSTFRAFTDYVLEFDSRLRNPKWVLEHFNAETMKGDGTR